MTNARTAMILEFLTGRVFRPLLLLSNLFLAIGCQSKSSTPSGQPAPQQSTVSTVEPAMVVETSPSEADPARTVNLTVATLDELQSAISGHKGKVVVCDFWSTSCEPCVKEFPHLVELSTRHSSEKLVCLSASLDYDGLPDQPLESLKTPVLEFLTQKKAAFSNYLISNESDQVYDKLKLSSIPAVYVYGVNGTLAKRFSEEEGVFSYEKDVIPFVEGLLK